MNTLIAFTKKEFLENLRTYRLFILMAALFVLGIMSPLLARLLPELLNSLGDGITYTKEPAPMDSWSQFYGNIGQMGMLLLIITYSGTVAGEISRGTLINLLTKGMKRRTVIYSKFLSASIIWAAGYLLSLGGCFAYTAYYWSAADLHHVLASFAALWLFGEFLIALVILGGVLFGNTYGSLLSCGGIYVILNLLNIAPAIQKYNPVTLTSSLSLLNGEKGLEDFIPAMIICAAATIIIITCTIPIFNKKHL